jgi:hypothetical protein
MIILYSTLPLRTVSMSKIRSLMVASSSSITVTGSDSGIPLVITPLSYSSSFGFGCIGA